MKIFMVSILTRYQNSLMITIRTYMSVGIGVDLGFNAQENTNKSLTTNPLGNTCNEYEVSPEVEAREVSRFKCLQP
jgi:hypothetical protein